MSELLEMFADAYSDHRYRMRTQSSRRELTWQDEGLCKETDPEMFYPDTGDNATQAKATCRTCPVQLKCAQYAIDNNEEYGIWGGLSSKTITRLRRRGRTRLTQDQLDRLMRREDDIKANRLATRRQW